MQCRAFVSPSSQRTRRFKRLRCHHEKRNYEHMPAPNAGEIIANGIAVQGRDQREDSRADRESSAVAAGAFLAALLEVSPAEIR